MKQVTTYEQILAFVAYHNEAMLTLEDGDLLIQKYHIPTDHLEKLAVKSFHTIIGELGRTHSIYLKFHDGSFSLYREKRIRVLFTNLSHIQFKPAKGIKPMRFELEDGKEVKGYKGLAQHYEVDEELIKPMVDNQVIRPQRPCDLYLFKYEGEQQNVALNGAKLKGTHSVFKYKNINNRWEKLHGRKGLQRAFPHLREEEVTKLFKELSKLRPSRSMNRAEELYHKYNLDCETIYQNKKKYFLEANGSERNFTRKVDWQRAITHLEGEPVGKSTINDIIKIIEGEAAI